MESYVPVALRHAGIKLKDANDSIMCSWNIVFGQVTTNLDYTSISNEYNYYHPKWLHTFLWHWKSLVKILCFTWLVIKNKILTGDNYSKEGGWA